MFPAVFSLWSMVELRPIACRDSTVMQCHDLWRCHYGYNENKTKMIAQDKVTKADCTVIAVFGYIGDSNKSFSVTIHNHALLAVSLFCGIPQDSTLGPILFAL